MWMLYSSSICTYIIILDMNLSQYMRAFIPNSNYSFLISFINSINDKGTLYLLRWNTEVNAMQEGSNELSDYKIKVSKREDIQVYLVICDLTLRDLLQRRNCDKYCYTHARSHDMLRQARAYSLWRSQSTRSLCSCWLCNISSNTFSP